ncbi:MAG: hypothetical protein IJJ33_11525, partial [Victivallales bacterium]|nr:hypothetical protein [Victivallales bacterium]
MREKELCSKWTHLGSCAVLCAAFSFLTGFEAKAQKAVEGKADPMIKATEISEREDVLRQEAFEVAQALFGEGCGLMELKDLKNASNRFEDAQAKLEEALKRADATGPLSEKAQELREVINKKQIELHKMWSEQLVREAKELTTAEKIDDALEHLSKAKSFDTLSKEERDHIDNRINDVQHEKKEIEFHEQTKVDTIIQDKADDDMEIAIMLERGRVYLQNGRYADARDTFEQVLLRDAYNAVATRYLARISQQLHRAADEKFKAILDERMAEVRWTWAEPVTPLLAGPGNESAVKAIKKTEMTTGLQNKMESIIIPEVKFRDQPLTEVFDKLRRYSVEFDPENEGVNFVLQLEKLNGARPTAAATSGGPGTPGFNASGEGGDGANPL